MEGTERKEPGAVVAEKRDLPDGEAACTEVAAYALQELCNLMPSCCILLYDSSSRHVCLKNVKFEAQIILGLL